MFRHKASLKDGEKLVRSRERVRRRAMYAKKREIVTPYVNYDADYAGQGIDQLQECIDKIRHHRTDRRIILSAWNPVGEPSSHLMGTYGAIDGRNSDPRDGASTVLYYMMCQFYVHMARPRMAKTGSRVSCTNAPLTSVSVYPSTSPSLAHHPAWRCPCLQGPHHCTPNTAPTTTKPFPRFM